MRFAIFGENNIDRILTNLIKLYNSKIPEGCTKHQVIAAISVFQNSNNEMGDYPLISIGDFLQFYKSNQLDGILIPREHISAATDLVSVLTKNGVSIEDIFVSKRLKTISALLDKDDLCSDDVIIEPYLDAKHLPYLEFHVADHCNLNCIACEHYSGLMKEEKFTDYNSWKSDMYKLHEYIDDIGTIRLLGGEPLLHKDLDLFLSTTRELYPDSIIMIVTNAILIKTMPQKLIDAIHKNNIAIYISYYLPLEKKMPEIEDFLKRENITYGMSPLITHFTKKQVLSPHDKMDESFANCSQSHCNNLYEGKVAACFIPFTTHYFNEYFDTSVPESGALDIYSENLTTRKIKEHLLTPWDRCRYCDIEEPVEWDIVKHPSDISLWIKDHNDYV